MPILRLILPVYIPTLVISFGRGMLIPILPLYASSFDVSYRWIGLVIASQAIGNILGDLPGGILSSRIGHKTTMLLGMVCMALAMFAMYQAGTIPELILYGFVAGMGMAFFNISRHAYIANFVASGQRGRAVSLFGGVNRIGTFAGPVVGGMIGEMYDLRTPFLIYAILAGISIVFPLLFAEQTESVPYVVQDGHQGHLQHLLSIAREHYQILTVAGAGQLFAQMIRGGRQVIIPLYAADILGLELADIGWIVSLSGAIDMSLFPVAGFVMDRLGRKFAYVPSFAIQAIGMALIPFTWGFSSLLAATLIIGFGNGLGSGSMMTLGADLSPRESMGEFLGIWRLIGDSGSAGAPMVVGGVADLIGLSPATFVIAGAGLVAAFTLGLWVPETLQKPEAVAL